MLLFHLDLVYNSQYFYLTAGVFITYYEFLLNVVLHDMSHHAAKFSAVTAVVVLLQAFSLVSVWKVF